MNQQASRIERVCNATREDSHLQSLEQHFDAVTGRRCLGVSRLKGGLETARAIGMITRKVEEFIEACPAPALPGDGPILGRGVTNDGTSVCFRFS